MLNWQVRVLEEIQVIWLKYFKRWLYQIKRLKIIKSRHLCIRNSGKKFIKNTVDCDWNECGKYFASSKNEDKKILEKFSAHYLI